MHKSKKKSHKDKKKRHHSSSDEWVEKTTCDNSSDSLEIMISSIPAESVQDIRSKRASENLKDKQLADQLKLKELNPYFKNGSSGIPSEGNIPNKKITTDSDWLMRAYNRALEQADREKVSFKEIAEQRWGSLETLYQLMEDSGIDVYKLTGKKVISEPKFHQEQQTFECDMFRKPGQLEAEASQTLLNSAGKEAYPEKTSKSTTTENVPKGINEENGNVAPIVTKELLNKLSAQIVKAEIMNDTEKIKSLKKKLDEANILFKSQEKQGAKPLTLTVVGSYEDNESKCSSQNPNRIPLGRRRPFIDNKRQEEFSDMVKAEKSQKSSDYHRAFLKLLAKSGGSRGKASLDDMFDSATAKNNTQVDNARDVESTICHQKAILRIVDSCNWCTEGSRIKHHLIIAFASKTYLSVPSYDPMVPHQCCISTNMHYVASNMLDEDVFEEIKNFKRHLVQLFKGHLQKEAVFFETVRNLNQQKHMFIDCIPLSAEDCSLAVMYFKKAILESEEEWSMNKKLHDLKDMDIRKTIPQGLPYFSVEFGEKNGFAHMIEDSSFFPQYFWKEVIGGMLDLEPTVWRNPRQQHHDQQRMRTQELQQIWETFGFPTSIVSSQT